MKPVQQYRYHRIELWPQSQPDGTWLCWVKIDGGDRINHGDKDGLPASGTDKVDAQKKALDIAKGIIDLMDKLDGR